MALCLIVGDLGGLPASAASGQFSSPAASYVFAFKDADIEQIAEQILGQALGVAYVVDPGVNAKMSFRIEQRLTQVQLLEAFEAALASVDVAIVRDGQTLILKPQSKAMVGARVRPASEGSRRVGYEVIAAPLSYASASEVAKALEAISPSKLVLYSNDKTGLILLGGSGQELASAMESIKLFDQNGLEDSKIGWFELEHAPAQTVADDLKRILEAANVSGVTIVPLKRLNGIFVFARTPEAVDQTSKWLRKLDADSREKSPNLWTYHPKNASAEDLAQTIGGLISDGVGSVTGQSGPNTQAQPSLNTGQMSSLGFGQLQNATGGFGNAPGLQSQSPYAQSIDQPRGPSSFLGSLGSGEGGKVRISVDRSANMLIVSAAPSDWTPILRMLQELDHAPAQILIEATILEVTLANDFKFGVDWAVFGANKRFELQAATSGAIGVQTPALSIAYLGKDIKAAINTLESKTDVQVVSAPKIIVLDNRSAKLEVGDQVPIVTQTQQSTSAGAAPLINSVDYRNTGVILNVTPRITGDESVSLNVSQEVSSVVQTTTSGINSPTIQQRRFESALVLTSGGVVALGGLISSTKSNSPTIIPGLGHAPLVGGLFRRETKTAKRTELIVLLSAKILRDRDDADHAMSDLLADMREIRNRGLIKRP